MGEYRNTVNLLWKNPMKSVKKHSIVVAIKDTDEN